MCQSISLNISNCLSTALFVFQRFDNNFVFKIRQRTDSRKQKLAYLKCCYKHYILRLLNTKAIRRPTRMAFASYRFLKAMLKEKFLPHSDMSFFQPLEGFDMLLPRWSIESTITTSPTAVTKLISSQPSIARLMNLPRATTPTVMAAPSNRSVFL